MSQKTNTVKQRKIYVDLETSYDVWESPTFNATIYVGFKPGYDGNIPMFSNTIAEAICKAYCDSIGLCVTIEETHFIYKNGSEPGIKVGLINYPRFPATKELIIGHALTLADRLKNEFKQHRVSVVTTDATYMLGDYGE